LLFCLFLIRLGMSLSQSINVGIVGLGWPGERHADALNASSLGNLYAACDLNAERLKTFADSFGPKQVFTSFDEMLLDPALDAVVIGLPNALHYPFSQKALHAGKHVLCEKPPTMNAEQMRTLHEEARNRGLVYYFGRQMRFSPAMQAAKKVIAERRLGEIYFAEHAVDAAWYLMGTPQPRAVSAQTYQKFPQLVESKVFDVEDNAYGMIRFENSATLLFKVCWAANLTDDIPLDPKRGRSLLSTTVYGPKGSLRVTDVFNVDSKLCPSPLALFEDQDGELVKSDLPVQDLRGAPLRAHEFAEQDNNFLRCIRGEESAVNSSSQAVQLMEILDAIYRSSQSGKEVPVA
jgi:predicted dehydrogenase